MCIPPPPPFDVNPPPPSLPSPLQAYGKIKRMLKRYHFVKMQRDQGEEDAEIKFAKQEGMLVLGVASASNPLISRARATTVAAATQHVENCSKSIVCVPQLVLLTPLPGNRVTRDHRHGI